MISTVQYWPNHKPVPDGWRECGSLGHHAAHARLIERVCEVGTPPSVVAVEHERGAALTGSHQGQPFTIPFSIAYAAQLAGELLLIVRTHLHRQGEHT